VKQKRFGVEQIVAVLKQAEAGVPLVDVKGGVKLDQRGGGKLDHLRKISGVDGAMGRDSWSGGLWSGLPDRV
jgi:hypothetical protein